MSKDQFIFYSSVNKKIKKKVLFRGIFVALSGMIPIAYFSFFFPPSFMIEWGFWLFIFWAAMTVWGLLPYKRLIQLETKPHKLIIDKLGFTVAFHGKDPFKISKSQVEAISYLKGKNEYGLFFELKKPLKSGRKKLFLPFFSERIYRELEEFFCT